MYVYNIKYDYKFGDEWISGFIFCILLIWNIVGGVMVEVLVYF